MMCELQLLADYCDRRTEIEKDNLLKAQYFPSIEYFKGVWTIQILKRFHREENTWSCGYLIVEATGQDLNEAFKEMLNKIKE